MVSQALSTTTITNDGSTLTVGDEATVSGGGGSGAEFKFKIYLREVLMRLLSMWWTKLPRR